MEMYASPVDFVLIGFYPKPIASIPRISYPGGKVAKQEALVDAEGDLDIPRKHTRSWHLHNNWVKVNKPQKRRECSNIESQKWPLESSDVLLPYLLEPQRIEQHITRPLQSPNPHVTRLHGYAMHPTLLCPNYNLSITRFNTSVTKKKNQSLQKQCFKVAVTAIPRTIEMVGSSLWPACLRMLDYLHTYVLGWKKRSRAETSWTKQHSQHEITKSGNISAAVGICSYCSSFQAAYDGTSSSKLQDLPKALITSRFSTPHAPSQLEKDAMDHQNQWVVVELGCGVGAVGPVLSYLLPDYLSCLIFLTDSGSDVLKYCEETQKANGFRRCMISKEEENFDDHWICGVHNATTDSHVEKKYLISPISKNSNTGENLDYCRTASSISNTCSFSKGKHSIRCRKLDWKQLHSLLTRSWDTTDIQHWDQLFKKHLTNPTACKAPEAPLQKDYHKLETAGNPHENVGSITSDNCYASETNQFVWSPAEVRLLLGSVNIFLACDVLYDFDAIDAFAVLVHHLLHRNPLAKFFLVHETRLNLITPWNLIPSDVFFEHFRSHYVQHLYANKSIASTLKINHPLPKPQASYAQCVRFCDRRPPYFDLYEWINVDRFFAINSSSFVAHKTKHASLLKKNGTPSRRCGFSHAVKLPSTKHSDFANPNATLSAVLKRKSVAFSKLCRSHTAEMSQQMAVPVHSNCSDTYLKNVHIWELSLCEWHSRGEITEGL